VHSFNLATIQPGRRQKRNLPFTLRHNLAMVQHESAWTFEHSIECGVTAESVDLLDERQQLGLRYGRGVGWNRRAVRSGRGGTNSKSSGLVEWRVTEVQTGKAVIEGLGLNCADGLEGLR
jgi:hypothetical protein